MSLPNLPRRRFLAAATATSAASLLAGQASAASEPAAAGSEEFQYEVTRSFSEWLSRLSEQEFQVMRLNQTEVPRSSPLWQETRAGTYCCRGCDLTLYDSDWKVILPMGWVFFHHSRPNAVLTSIDSGPQPADAEVTEEASADMGNGDPDQAFVEAHCRRCGSHLGHIVAIEGQVLQCINGTSLDFQLA